MQAEMVHCVALTSCTLLFSNRHQSRTNFCVPRRVVMSSLQREYKLFWNDHLSGRHLLPNLHYVQESSYKNFIKCCCFGAIMNSEIITPASLASYVDEALLVVSVILAYMAGAIPQKSDITRSRCKNSEQSFEDSSSIPYENSTESKSSDYWSEVNEKVLGASSVSDHDCTFIGKNVESEIQSRTYPLSLFSLTEGPRWRLLSVALQQLQKKVNNILPSDENISQGDWVMAASEVAVQSVHSACSNWLQEEAKLNTENHDMKINVITAKLRKDDSVLKNINRSGKLELYADLLFFLRFGYLRTSSCYDSKLLTRNAVNILEDLVIMLADNIAWIYLELLSVDGNMSAEINSMSLDLCALSTRELQRLRNEVVLNQWLVQYFESVVSIYEDRYDLSILYRLKQEDPLDLDKDKRAWWKKLIYTKSKLPSLNYVSIRPMSLSIKRTKELRALTGWRYYFSLYLELSDITMPLAKTIFTKITSAISFFLVCMVGRSLGLIFTGIKQSLGWR